jgi:Flp pilus assembly protein TadG
MLRARRGDRGAAAVEFALVLVPLMLIVFGIISFGMMLSFRQTLSQAATEGARAAAVQIDATKRSTDAVTAVNDAMGDLSFQAATCGSGGLTCEVTESTCGDAQCVTVELSFAYEANAAIQVPLDGALIPDDLVYSATVRVS